MLSAQTQSPISAPRAQDFLPMPTHICHCEECSRDRTEDPDTGLMIYGREVGHKEFLAHNRLTRVKQCFNETTITGIGIEDASIQMGPRSQNHITIAELEQGLGTTPVEGSPRPECANLLSPAAQRYSLQPDFPKPTKTRSRKCGHSFHAGEWTTSNYP